jgi:tight adherence protein B
MTLIAVTLVALAVWSALDDRSASRRVDVHIDRRHRPGAWVALGVAVVATVVGMSLVVVGFAMTAAWLARHLLRHRSARRLRAARRAAIVEFTFALAAELRSGQPPAAAVAAAATGAGPLEHLLTASSTAVRNGAHLDEELSIIAATGGCERLTAVSAAWRATHPIGAGVADVLDRVAESFESDDAAADDLDSALAGPRATMMMLATLPVIGIALGESIGAHPLRLLIHRPLGWCLVCAAMLLDAAGVLWTKRMVRSALAH